jgi:hypothetical protein
MVYENNVKTMPIDPLANDCQLPASWESQVSLSGSTVLPQKKHKSADGQQGYRMNN